MSSDLLARAANFGSATGEYMSSEKTVVAHPPESKLKKLAIFIRGLFKFISGLMFILKVINKCWDFLQKVLDFFVD
jgi:hypothetical protein